MLIAQGLIKCVENKTQRYKVAKYFVGKIKEYNFTFKEEQFLIDCEANHPLS